MRGRRRAELFSRNENSENSSRGGTAESGRHISRVIQVVGVRSTSTGSEADAPLILHIWMQTNLAARQLVNLGVRIHGRGNDLPAPIHRPKLTRVHQRSSSLMYGNGDRAHTLFAFVRRVRIKIMERFCVEALVSEMLPRISPKKASKVRPSRRREFNGAFAIFQIRAQANSSKREFQESARLISTGVSSRSRDARAPFWIMYPRVPPGVLTRPPPLGAESSGL